MAGAATARSYEDFEPFCKWKREERQDALEVHLQGFTKEQVRVQLLNHASIILTGERSLGDQNNWSRFRKEIKVSKDCETNKIHARLCGGILYIAMPKKQASSSSSSSQGRNQVKGGRPAKPRVDLDDSIRRDATVEEMGTRENTNTTTKNDSMVSAKDRRNKILMEDLVLRFRMREKVNVGAAVAVVAAVVAAFIMYFN